jgi:hypothetical protein
MRKARDYIVEYGRRSARFNSQAADRYLVRLSQMSAPQMKEWLAKFESRQGAVARSDEVARAARQTAVDQAIGRLQAVQQSYDAFNQGRTLGALTARDQIDAQRQFTDQMSAARQMDRNATLTQFSLPTYDWIVNPPYRMRAAAAAVLPGDLPAGDPRNFIRGDVLSPEQAASAAAAAASVGIDSAGNAVAAPPAAPAPAPSP